MSVPTSHTTLGSPTLVNVGPDALHVSFAERPTTITVNLPSPSRDTWTTRVVVQPRPIIVEAHNKGISLGEMILAAATILAPLVVVYLGRNVISPAVSQVRRGTKTLDKEIGPVSAKIRQLLDNVRDCNISWQASYAIEAGIWAAVQELDNLVGLDWHGRLKGIDERIRKLKLAGAAGSADKSIETDLASLLDELNWVAQDIESNPRLSPRRIRQLKERARKEFPAPQGPGS